MTTLWQWWWTTWWQLDDDDNLIKKHQVGQVATALWLEWEETGPDKLIAGFLRMRMIWCPLVICLSLSLGCYVMEWEETGRTNLLQVSSGWGWCSFDFDDYNAEDMIYILWWSVCLSRKMITSHFQAERQRREVSCTLGLAGCKPALA